MASITALNFYLHNDTTTFSGNGSNGVTYIESNFDFYISGTVKDASLAIKKLTVTLSLLRGESTRTIETEVSCESNDSKTSFPSTFVTFAKDNFQYGDIINSITVTAWGKFGIWYSTETYTKSIGPYVIQNYISTERIQDEVKIYSVDGNSKESSFYYNNIVCQWPHLSGINIGTGNTNKLSANFYRLRITCYTHSSGQTSYYCKIDTAKKTVTFINTNNEQIEAPFKASFNLNNNICNFIINILDNDLDEKLLQYYKISFTIYSITSYQDFWLNNISSATSGSIESTIPTTSVEQITFLSSMKTQLYPNNPIEDKIIQIILTSNVNNSYLQEILKVSQELTITVPYIDTETNNPLETEVKIKTYNYSYAQKQLSINLEYKELIQAIKGDNWDSTNNNNGTWIDNLVFNLVIKDKFLRTFSFNNTINNCIILKSSPYWTEAGSGFKNIQIRGVDQDASYNTTKILNPKEKIDISVYPATDPNKLEVFYEIYYGISNELVTPSLDYIQSLELNSVILYGENNQIDLSLDHQMTQYIYFYCIPKVELTDGLDSSLFQATPEIYADYIRIGRIAKPTLDLCTTDLTGITYRFSDNGGDQNLDIGKNYEDYLVTDDIKYGGTNLTRFGTEYLEIALTDEYGNEIDFSLNTEDTFFIKRKMGVINNDEDDDIEFIELELEEARRMLLENQKNTFAIGLAAEEIAVIQEYLTNEEGPIYVRGRFYYSTNQQTETPAIVLNSTGLNEVIEQQEVIAPSGCIQFIHELTIKILGPTIGYRKNGLIINPATGGQDQLGSEEILKINLTSTRKNINIYDNDGELCVSIYRDTEGKFHLKGAIIDELEERIAALEAHHG